MQVIISFGLLTFSQCGGCIVGLVDKKGEFTGKEIAYLYPDQKIALYGSFKVG